MMTGWRERRDKRRSRMEEWRENVRKTVKWSCYEVYPINILQNKDGEKWQKMY